KTECGPGMKLDVHICQFSIANMKSVVGPFHCPLAAQQIADQTIKRDLGFGLNSDVPFIPRPRILFPPISGRAPGAGGPDNFSGNFFSLGTLHARRLPLAQSDLRESRGTKNSQRGDCTFLPISFLGSVV